MASKSVVAKNRFHKGTTAAFRKLMRSAGISFDEEQAQFILGGIMPFAGQPSEIIELARSQVISDRHKHNAEWIKLNPKRNPFAPSFPDRVLTLARKALEEYRDEGSDPMMTLMRLEAIASAETRSDPFGPPDDVEIG